MGFPGTSQDRRHCDLHAKEVIDMTSPLFVGIDVGSESNVVCCLTRDEEKRPLSRFSITNNRPGILALQERILCKSMALSRSCLAWNTRGAIRLTRPCTSTATWILASSAKMSMSLIPVSSRNSRRRITWTPPKTIGSMPGSLPPSFVSVISPIPSRGANRSWPCSA